MIGIWSKIDVEAIKNVNSDALGFLKNMPNDFMFSGFHQTP